MNAGKIILEYLNTLPLSAQAGYGEVHGLGEGLHAWFGITLNSEIDRLSSGVTEERAGALKNILALLCAVRAPTYYLQTNRSALDVRIARYVHLMREGRDYRHGDSRGRTSCAVVGFESCPDDGQRLHAAKGSLFHSYRVS
jgi:hypothetical protein